MPNNSTPSLHTPQIALAIYGNRLTGFESICQLNNPPEALPHMSYGGLDANPYYVILHTTANYTQFTLVQNGVMAYGASRRGFLKMAIFLPHGWRPKEGRAPIDLLLEVRQRFTDHYMTPVQGATAGFRFKETTDCGQEFAQLLAEWKLEAHPAPNRPMKGQDTGLLLLEKGKWADLSRDVYYPEFEAYREVIVAETGTPSHSENPALIASTQLINNTKIQVPRRPTYKLFVNGLGTPWPVADPYSQPCRLTQANFDVRCFDTDVLDFCLKDLLAGKVVPGVKLDVAEERIDCTISLHPKTKTYSVILDGLGKQADIALFMSGLRIALPDGRLVTVNKKSDGTYAFSLTGNDIVAALRISCSDGHFSIGRCRADDKDKYWISVTRKPEPQPQPRPQPNAKSVKQLVLVFAKKEDCYYDVRLSCAGQELSGCYRPRDKRLCVDIPEYWSGQVKINVGLKDRKNYRTGSQYLKPEGPTEVSLQSLTPMFPIFWELHVKLPKVMIILLVAFLLGGICGWFVRGGSSGTANGVPADSTKTNSSLDMVLYYTPEEVKYMRKVLDDKDLTFAKVNDMDPSKVQDEGLRQLIYAYQAFASAVEQHLYDDAKSLARQLNGTHKRLFEKYDRWVKDAQTVFEQNRWSGFADIQKTIDEEEEKKKADKERAAFQPKHQGDKTSIQPEGKKGGSGPKTKDPTGTVR